MLPGQAVALIVVSSVFSFLAIVSVVWRIYARYRTQNRLDASDYFIFFTLLCAILNAINSIIGAVDCGVGLPLSDLQPYMQFFYLGAVWGVKMSVLLFYRAIFGANDKVMTMVRLTFIVLTAWIISFFFATLFQDIPISANWTNKGHVADWRVLYFVLNLTDLLLDIFVLTMPMFGLQDLKLSRRRKQQLIGVFLMGAVIVVASTVRLAYVILEDVQYKEDKSNFSFMIINTVIWGSIEPCTSVIAACLPVIGAALFLRKPRNKAFYDDTTPAVGDQVVRDSGGIVKPAKVLDSIDLLELSALNSGSTRNLIRQDISLDREIQTQTTQASQTESTSTKAARSMV